MPFKIEDMKVEEVGQRLKNEGVDRVRFIEYYREPGNKRLRFFMEDITGVPINDSTTG